MSERLRLKVGAVAAVGGEALDDVEDAARSAAICASSAFTSAQREAMSAAVELVAFDVVAGALSVFAG